MIKVFLYSELQELVKPADLLDVIDTLIVNGLLLSYSIEYDTGEIELEIPRDVEIKEMITGLQNAVHTTRKGTIH